MTKTQNCKLTNKQSRISPNQKNDSKDNLYTNKEVKLDEDYFVAASNMETAKGYKLQNELSNTFTGIWCFTGRFSLKVKDAKPYQAPPRPVASLSKETFKNTGATRGNSFFIVQNQLEECDCAWTQ